MYEIRWNVMKFCYWSAASMVDPSASSMVKLCLSKDLICYFLLLLEECLQFFTIKDVTDLRNYVLSGFLQLLPMYVYLKMFRSAICTTIIFFSDSY